MILCSTLRNLAAKGANIYKVDVPAFTFQGVTIPEHHQYFATRAQAEKFAASTMLPGALVPRISSERAGMEKHYLLT